MVLVLLFAIVWLLKHDAPEAAEGEPGAPTTRAQQREGGGRLDSGEQAGPPSDPEARAAYLNTSIKVYGKVMDQFGESVAGASVNLSPTNWFGDSGGDRTVITDADGRFSADGMYGSSLGITAMKEGYLRIPPKIACSSQIVLGYKRDGGGTGAPHTNPSNPVVLSLLKIGPVEPMIHVDKRLWKLPLDGTPRKIALDSEKGQGAHEIEFRLTSNRREPGRDLYAPFDWSFEIRVPGGGLAWDRSDLEFEAPAAGYGESVRYDFQAAMPSETWKRYRDGRYFVKFADGTYGRIQFNIDGGSDRGPLYMESWLCLTPNSRNLATDRMIINIIESEDPDR